MAGRLPYVPSSQRHVCYNTSTYQILPLDRPYAEVRAFLDFPFRFRLLQKTSCHTSPHNLLDLFTKFFNFSTSQI